MKVHSSNHPLTTNQLAIEERNAAKGLHADVKAAKLFGPKSDSMLAQRVYAERPALYMTLRQEYRYEIGEARRPYEGQVE